MAIPFHLTFKDHLTSTLATDLTLYPSAFLKRVGKIIRREFPLWRGKLPPYVGRLARELEAGFGRSASTVYQQLSCRRHQALVAGAVQMAPPSGR